MSSNSLKPILGGAIDIDSSAALLPDECLEVFIPSTFKAALAEFAFYSGCWRFLPKVLLAAKRWSS